MVRLPHHWISLRLHSRLGDDGPDGSSPIVINDTSMSVSWPTRGGDGCTHGDGGGEHLSRYRSNDVVEEVDTLADRS